jgi:signal transduction histidine kinase
LAAGTGYGLYGYYLSYKITVKKLQELDATTKLVQGVTGLEQIDPNDRQEAYLLQIENIRLQLAEYKDVNRRTVEAGLDPDNGEEEDGHMADLKVSLQKLNEAVQASKVPRLGSDKTDNKIDDVRAAQAKVRLNAEALRSAVVSDIQKNGESSAATVRQSIWWVSFSLVWATALVLTMLYYFRAWMLTPIRELQAGVQRVHSGNFAQPIGLTSGDELQELADEFDSLIARLHAVYADLARQVNERSRQLVRSERMVSVGFLAAGVAHEINNPLASILFCSEALERRLQDVLAALVKTASGTQPAEVEVLTRYLKMIQQEALRCKDITQKLLDFSRTGERRKEPTDLTGLVRGVLEVARHLPSSRGKTVSFEPSGYIVAPVNAQDLKSVILNLVVNALDSMDDGGQLAITLVTAAGYAELVFADTGCGMAADVLQNIFEPFYTKSRTGKGTGLGLFISHQIVDQHGGTITATSSGPGTGSTFVVRIPLELAPGDTAGQVPDADPDPAPTVLTFPGRREAA